MVLVMGCYDLVFGFGLGFGCAMVQDDCAGIVYFGLRFGLV